MTKSKRTPNLEEIAIHHLGIHYGMEIGFFIGGTISESFIVITHRTIYRRQQNRQSSLPLLSYLIIAAYHPLKSSFTINIKGWQQHDKPTQFRFTFSKICKLCTHFYLLLAFRTSRVMDSWPIRWQDTHCGFCQRIRGQRIGGIALTGIRREYGVEMFRKVYERTLSIDFVLHFMKFPNI